MSKHVMKEDHFSSGNILIPGTPTSLEKMAQRFTYTNPNANIRHCPLLRKGRNNIVQTLVQAQGRLKVILTGRDPGQLITLLMSRLGRACSHTTMSSLRT